MSTASSVSSSSSWVSRASAYQEAVGDFTRLFASFSAKKLVEHALALSQLHGFKKYLYLDLASGTGVTIWEFLKYWQAAAIKADAEAEAEPNRIVPAKLEVEIQATDFADTMLDLLKASIPATLPQGISRVSCSLLNMEEIADFLKVTSKNSVQLLNCCFGIMFPKNTEQVLTNFYEVLSPYGMATIVTWHYTIILDIIETLARAQKKISETERLPTSLDFLKFGDENTMRIYLRKAGFQDSALKFYFESFEHTTSANALVKFLKSNPAYSQYFEDDELVAKVMKELQPNVSASSGKEKEKEKEKDSCERIVLRATALTIICKK